MNFPALNRETVTESHTEICAQRGHATHTVNGVDTGVCPRCGDVTDAAPVAGEFPRKDQHHPVTYWTGPVGQPGTHVTGHKSRKGATVNYYSVSCTCKTYGSVTEEITGHSFGEVRAQLERMAYDHAATH